MASSQNINNLSGEGARIFGGRWNPPGIGILYTSSSFALAVLSVFIHIPSGHNRRSFSVATIEIPDDSIEKLNSDSLRLISSKDSRFSTVKNWVDRKENLALEVPSEIIPNEHYILINTDHPSFKNVKLVNVNPFAFDSDSEEVITTKS